MKLFYFSLFKQTAKIPLLLLYCIEISSKSHHFLMLTDQKKLKIDVLPFRTEDKLDSSPQKQTGHWNEEQQKKYVIFIDFFKKELNSKLKRRNNKLFKIMASFIETRNSVQCRCHHTKLIRTFKHINKIVKNFQSEIGFSEYLDLQKKMLASSPIFDSSSNEFQEATKLIPVKSRPQHKSVGIQTDEIIQQNCEIPFISTPSYIEQQDQLFNYFIYPTHFFLFCSN